MRSAPEERGRDGGGGVALVDVVLEHQAGAQAGRQVGVVLVRVVGVQRVRHVCGGGSQTGVRGKGEKTARRSSAQSGCGACAVRAGRDAALAARFSPAQLAAGRWPAAPPAPWPAAAGAFPPPTSQPHSNRPPPTQHCHTPAEIKKELRMARCTAPSAPPASSCVTRVMQSRITGLPAPCGGRGWTECGRRVRLARRRHGRRTQGGGDTGPGGSSRAQPGSAAAIKTFCNFKLRLCRRHGLQAPGSTAAAADDAEHSARCRPSRGSARPRRAGPRLLDHSLSNRTAAARVQHYRERDAPTTHLRRVGPHLLVVHSGSAAQQQQQQRQQVPSHSYQRQRAPAPSRTPPPRCRTAPPRAPPPPPPAPRRCRTCRSAPAGRAG